MVVVMRNLNKKLSKKGGSIALFSLSLLFLSFSPRPPFPSYLYYRSTGTFPKPTNKALRQVGNAPFLFVESARKATNRLWYY
jgi:hypothetical protein